MMTKTTNTSEVSLEPVLLEDVSLSSADEPLTVNQVDVLLQHLSSKFKRRFIVEKMSKVLPWLLAMSLLVYIFTYEQESTYDFTLTTFILVTFILMNGIAYIVIIKSLGYKAITAENILFHLNHQFPQLNESAQLAIKSTGQLNQLQTLQKRKTLSVLSQLVNSQQVMIPKLSVTPVLIQSAFVLFAFGVCILLLNNSELNGGGNSDLHPELNGEPNNNGDKFNAIASKLLFSKTLVSAPKYAQLPDIESNALDLTLLEGSKVSWQLSFSQPQLAYQLVFADGTEIALEKQPNGDFIAQHYVKNTGLYKINSLDNTFTSLHTLTVNNDDKPKVRFISPKRTVSEIATNGRPILQAQVNISDDFSVSKVEILASIAKGSGEGVKFRDQTFSFDHEKQGSKGELYAKQWNLAELGMEPGDELYFSVRAWDNKEPNAQLTRSATKIIRWLEDEEQGMLSSGLLIDFMPEYFKSQRQIIIETIALIDDKKQLSRDVFSETSELLGVAQSSLKEKYGQYLGDEVESGNLENVDFHNEAHHTETDGKSSTESNENHHENEDHNNAKTHETVEEHHHDEGGSDQFEMKAFGTDRSGFAEQMSRFGHNHGDADIGIISKQNPKALMKISIANMWQAELHLMQSEPSKALPFEQTALKFLNMAKKAERIYVKRLGFEPPPVTEKRRYQGKLDEIFSYQKVEKRALGLTDNQALVALFQSLNQYSLDKKSASSLTKQQHETLTNAKNVITVLLKERPSLITSLVTIEKILLVNSLYLKDCDNCLLTLQSKLWQMITPLLAKPNNSNAAYSDRNMLLQQYSEFLENNK